MAIVEEASNLPWEAAEDARPQAVGICLSGGGLRAASYGLGVLQALQQEHGLLWGQRAADYLSVVSGGSYVGASYIAVAASLQAPGEPTPLAPGAPETQHLMSHGRYLVEDGWPKFVWRIGSRAVLSAAATLVLFLWVALFVALFHQLAAEYLQARPAENSIVESALAGLAILALARIARGAMRAGGILRYLEPLVFMGVLVVCLPSFFGFIDRVGPLNGATWSSNWPVRASFLAAALVLASLLSVISRGLRGTTWGLVAGVTGTWLSRAVGLVVFAIAASHFDGILEPIFEPIPPEEALERCGLWFVSITFGAVVAEYAAQRATIHDLYRDMLGRCFAVKRDGDTASAVTPANSILLSGLPTGDGRLFPTILICATANVSVKDAAGRRSRFSAFVFSFNRCGIPGAPDASFSTASLERGRIAGRFLGDVPLSSLMDSVACTGAAISPSMGHDSLSGARPLLSILNFRLGQWYPNPHSRRVRQEVESRSVPGRLLKDRGLGYGFGYLVQDLFGLQPGDGKWIYVSDGGHYDNLGLITLLRARCREIWCVDSDADSSGSAKTLRAVLNLARSELDIDWELDLEAFRAEGGLLGTSHIDGRIRYKDGSEAHIIVVKLGLTSDASPELTTYQLSDRRFPYHPTFVQWYSRPRFNAYRMLGYENGLRASQTTIANPT